MRKYKTSIVIFVFLLIIAIISGINLYLLFENLNTRDERVKRNVEEVVATINANTRPISTIAPVEIHTPVKGIDYSDGKAGKDGTNGKDGFNGTNGISIKGDMGIDGKDGLTLEIRCNTVKNRWETRYVGDPTWQIMNGETVKCTIDNQSVDVFNYKRREQ